MPIRGLESHLRERGLVQVDSIASLENARIGVEGVTWMKTLDIREPFQIAMGGEPLTLRSSIVKNVQAWRNARITPLLVFQGLNMKRDRAPFGGSDIRSQKRRQAWERYINGDLSLATTSFQDAEKFIGLNFIRNAIAYLSEQNVQYFQAPYLPWAQLAWFAQPRQNIVQGIFGGLELLLFGVHRIILSVNFENGTYEFAEYNSVLMNLNLSKDQFLDACILAGFDYSQTFPPLRENFSFHNAAELVRSYGTGYNVIQAYSAHPQVASMNYLDVFLKSRCLVLHHIIYEPTGVCSSFITEGCPNDLHEMFGFRLPPEVYYLLGLAVISAQTINNLLLGYQTEAPPLVESDDYRNLLDDLVEVRTKAMALLTAQLHDLVSQKRVKHMRWYEPDAEYELNHSQYKDLVRSLVCNISQAEIDKALSRKSYSSLNSSNGIHVVIDILLERSNAPESKSQTIATSADELFISILCHSLQLMNYVKENYEPTPFLQALKSFSPQNLEYGLIIAELLRVRKLTGQRFTNTGNDNTNDRYEREESVTLISRCLSVLPVKFEARSWSGPIDHDLMAFNSLVKTLYKSIRNLLEMDCLSLTLRNKVKISAPQFSDVGGKLPFLQENNTAMGIVSKAFLLERCAAKELQTLFPTCCQPLADLTNAYLFWKEVMGMVQFMHQAKLIEDSTHSSFEAADQFFAKFAKDLA